MRILIDADACPVVKQAEQVAKKFNIPVILFYDTSHQTKSDYSEIILVDKGNDSVDFRLVNYSKENDIIITQDYGLACMCLSKNTYPINQNGWEYNNKNIDSLLETRYLSKKIRNSSKHHLKGPKKRTYEDDLSFISGLTALIKRVIK